MNATGEIESAVLNTPDGEMVDFRDIVEIPIEDGTSQERKC